MCSTLSISPPPLKVYQVPIEECSQHIDCTSCTNDLNPLCGWCVVENKCSRQTQCQNSSLIKRWTQENTNCFTTTVDPMRLVLDPTILANVVRYICINVTQVIQTDPTVHGDLASPPAWRKYILSSGRQ